ncbi:MAG: aminoacyl-tRNA hydrolase [Pirellulaceae bacterium]|nr:MAG: aminoacyl-tRNA hydrolase [Pirellulaceae bacterium]
MPSLHVNDKYEIPEEELEWSFARSGGPGGQNVNKVNSKAILRWTPDPRRLPPSVWRRLQQLGKRYLTNDGTFVIQSQEYRDREQNRTACQHRLLALVRTAWTPPKHRIPTRPTQASRRRRLEEKKRLSRKKQSRRDRDFD